MKTDNDNFSALKHQDIDWLRGKKINSADSISTTMGYGIYYIFNHYDCGTCINTGFLIVNRIDRVYKRECVKVIASMVPNVAPIQRLNGYKGYIYMDSKDLIRRELKYSPTPMLIIVDGSNTIIDALFPTDNSRNSEYSSFLDMCVKYVK